MSNPDLGVNEPAEQVLNTMLRGGKSESLTSTTAKGTEVPVRQSHPETNLILKCYEEKGNILTSKFGGEFQNSSQNCQVQTLKF